MDADLVAGPTYNADQLLETRKKLGLTQSQMGALMGLSHRAYQALESGQNPVKQSHVMLMLYASMRYVAVEGHHDAVTKLDPWLVSEARKIAVLADKAQITSPSID